MLSTPNPASQDASPSNNQLIDTFTESTQPPKGRDVCQKYANPADDPEGELGKKAASTVFGCVRVLR
jgi:hypothetical protein